MIELCVRMWSEHFVPREADEVTKVARAETVWKMANQFIDRVDVGPDVTQGRVHAIQKIPEIVNDVLSQGLETMDSWMRIG